MWCGPGRSRLHCLIGFQETTPSLPGFQRRSVTTFHIHTCSPPSHVRRMLVRVRPARLHPSLFPDHPPIQCMASTICRRTPGIISRGISRTPATEWCHSCPSIALPVQGRARAREPVALALHISPVFTRQQFCQRARPWQLPPVSISTHTVSCSRSSAFALGNREEDRSL